MGKPRKRKTDEVEADGKTMIGRIPKPIWAAITTVTTTAVGLFMKWLHERPAKPRR